jgi:hypothetical protein
MWKPCGISMYSLVSIGAYGNARTKLNWREVHPDNTAGFMMRRLESQEAMSLSSFPPLMLSLTYNVESFFVANSRLLRIAHTAGKTG